MDEYCSASIGKLNPMSIFPGESEPLPDDDEEKRERNEDDLKCVVGDAAGVDSTKIKLILLLQQFIIPRC